MVRIFKNIVILFIFVLFTNTCAQQTAQNKIINFSEVDSLIFNSIEDQAFPGAVLLIWHSGKTLYKKGYGKFTYSDTSSVVTAETIFDIASLTKVIATTTAAMICYERNLFSLDDPVKKYLPEFGVNGKESVSIKNLLLHNSGLPAFKQFYKNYSIADDVIRDIYASRLNYNPGTKTVYSDLGMIVLAKVIEKVSGQHFDEFCRKEIFVPLQMNSTLFNPPDSLKYKIAPTEIDGYWRNRLIWGEVHDETASLLNGVAGHAGLFSTADDIKKLLINFIISDSGGKKSIFKKETIKLYTTRYSDESTRALGWDTKSEENSSAGSLFDISSFGHTGFTGTSVWIDPTRDLIVIFLTNRVYPSRENRKLNKLRPLLHDAVIKAIK